MESQKPTDNAEEEDLFFDALDDFPFYDCVSDHQPDHSASDAPSTALRRRKFSHRGTPAKDSGDSIGECSTKDDSSKTSSREWKQRFCRDSKGNEKNLEIKGPAPVRIDSVPIVEDKKEDESTITSARNDVSVHELRDSADSGAEPSESSTSSSNLLVFIAGLVIKAIGFQLNLLVSFVTLPMSVLYCCYMFIFDPFQAVRRGGVYVTRKLISLLNLICGCVCPFVSEWLKEHKSKWKLLFQLAWGLFWAIYVCCVLCGLLVCSFVISGFLMRYLVEEPLVIKQVLNFDYTKNSPVAFVPITSCAGMGCGVNCMKKIEAGKNVRFIPANHKLQATVLLTLPESEYNRNLGMFQVRVDFLSAYGEVLASSSYPCMLKFKSEPIRLLLTFLKAAPLVAGYVSESQTLNLKIRGLKEGEIPTACLRVMIEQRAEYRPGAGIPEIYDASVILDSELPLFKKIIWSWKKTIYIWVSMTLLMMELVFTLVCCRHMLIPRTRQTHGSLSSSTQNSSQAQSGTLQSRW